MECNESDGRRACAFDSLMVVLIENSYLVFSLYTFQGVELILHIVPNSSYHSIT